MPFPPNVNPHPVPNERHHHPNQAVFVGPVVAHAPVENVEVDVQEDDDWQDGHWALPPQPAELVDVEL